MVTYFTGHERFSELWQNDVQAVKCVTTCKPSLAQLNLDSPQHALSDGYRVWGVKVTLGYEGKVRSMQWELTLRASHIWPWSIMLCFWWAGSLHHLLHFCRSLFVLIGTGFGNLVDAPFAPKVSV